MRRGLRQEGRREDRKVAECSRGGTRGGGDGNVIQPYEEYLQGFRHWASPDDEGIETPLAAPYQRAHREVTGRAPMMRGLKPWPESWPSRWTRPCHWASPDDEGI